MEEVFERLKQMREEAGLRQGQIADYLGVTQTYISKVETGERNLAVEQLERLLAFYGHCLATFEKPKQEVHPIRFAFRAQDVSKEDMRIIAEIGRIAINSRFMTKLLEESHD